MSRQRNTQLCPRETFGKEAHRVDARVVPAEPAIRAATAPAGAELLPVRARRARGAVVLHLRLLADHLGARRRADRELQPAAPSELRARLPGLAGRVPALAVRERLKDRRRGYLRYAPLARELS